MVLGGGDIDRILDHRVQLLSMGSVPHEDNLVYLKKPSLDLSDTERRNTLYWKPNIAPLLQGKKWAVCTTKWCFVKDSSCLSVSHRSYLLFCAPPPRDPRCALYPFLAWTLHISLFSGEIELNVICHYGFASVSQMGAITVEWTSSDRREAASSQILHSAEDKNPYWQCLYAQQTSPKWPSGSTYRLSH